MSRTLLNEVNAVLKKAGLIQGTTGALTTLTDSALQVDIDNCVKAWNTALADLAHAGINISIRSAGTLTLVADQREYDVPATFVEMASDVMIDETLGNLLHPYPGGYDAMRLQQTIPTNYTGLPYRWAINPVTGKFRLDNSPTAAEDGRVYNFVYKGTLLLTAAADVFPLKDDATERLEDCATQLYQRYAKGQFDQQAYQLSIARAAQAARQLPQHDRYGVVTAHGAS